jgi:hypothetical protein
VLKRSVCHIYPNLYLVCTPCSTQAWPFFCPFSSLHCVPPFVSSHPSQPPVLVPISSIFAKLLRPKLLGSTLSSMTSTRVLLELEKPRLNDLQPQALIEPLWQRCQPHSSRQKVTISSTALAKTNIRGIVFTCLLESPLKQLNPETPKPAAKSELVSQTQPLLDMTDQIILIRSQAQR